MTICHTGTLDTSCAKSQLTIFTFLCTDLVTVLNLFKHDLARGSLNMKWPRRIHMYSYSPPSLYIISQHGFAGLFLLLHPHVLFAFFTSFGFNKIIITAVARTQSCHKVGGEWFYERRGFTDERHLWKVLSRCSCHTGHTRRV